MENFSTIVKISYSEENHVDIEKLTASGCFHGQDRLLSIAPICTFTFALRFDDSFADIGCSLRYGSTEFERLPGFAGMSATMDARCDSSSILIIQLSKPLSVFRII